MSLSRSREGYYTTSRTRNIVRGSTVFRSRVPVLLVVCCLLSVGSFTVSQIAVGESAHRFVNPRNTLLPLASLGLAQSSIPVAAYDEQLGTTFNQDFPSLGYNVTAVNQSDVYGYGPGYFLNGLSNQGYWYQVGLCYDWPYNDGGYSQGFHFIYEVFNTNGASVFPRGGAGLSPFTGPVYSDDSILLDLNFSSGNVIMQAQDWNTGATAQATYGASGATYFSGLTTPANSNGFFTGLMTEWYHADPYLGGEAAVTYSNYNSSLSSAFMWMDEYDPSNLSWTGSWSAYTPAPVQYSPDLYQLQTFSSHGATECSNAYELITGSSIHDVSVQLSLAKTIVGEGYLANITGTVNNTGDSEETFNLTVLANQTFLQTQTFTLSNGSSTVWQVAWNTSGFIKGNCTISANVELATGETNAANDSSASSSLILTFPGDLNGDFKVNLFDLVIMANAYGSHPGDAKWNPNADINGDNAVSLADLTILAQHYGQQ